MALSDYLNGPTYRRRVQDLESQLVELQEALHNRRAVRRKADRNKYEAPRRWPQRRRFGALRATVRWRTDGVVPPWKTERRC